MLRATVSGVPTYPDDAWERLGEAVARRRVRLGMTQDQLADDAAISTNTVRHIEQGGRARLLTLPKIEDALRWEPGSAANILEGRDAIDIGSAIPSPATVAKTDAIERPDGLTDGDWQELRGLLNGIIASWVTARRS